MLLGVQWIKVRRPSPAILVRIIENWFHENMMIFGNLVKLMTLYIFNGTKLTNSCEGEKFCVISDNELKFEPHIRTDFIAFRP